MRPFIASLVVLFAAAGCTEDNNPSAFEPEYSVRVIGAFERLNPDDPNSKWVGVEVTRIVDHQGSLICENEVDTEGWEVEDPNAELSLEMVREAALEVRAECAREYEEQTSQLTEVGYLSFEARNSRYGEQVGTVYTSEDLVTWEAYATGMLVDDTLAYHSTRWVFADAFHSRPSGEPEIRDLAEPPLQQ